MADRNAKNAGLQRFEKGHISVLELWNGASHVHFSTDLFFFFQLLNRVIFKMSDVFWKLVLWNKHIDHRSDVQNEHEQTLYYSFVYNNECVQTILQTFPDSVATFWGRITWLLLVKAGGVVVLDYTTVTNLLACREG